MANKTISELPRFDGSFADVVIPIVDMNVPDTKMRNRRISGTRFLEQLAAVDGGTPPAPEFFSSSFFKTPFFT